MDTLSRRPFRDPLPDVTRVDTRKLADAGRLASQAGVDPSQVRTDAVTLGCAALYLQQAAESDRYPTPHQLLDPGKVDQALDLLAHALDRCTALHPEVFPRGLTMPAWPELAMQRLLEGLWSVDLVGGRDQRHSTDRDAISDLFGHSASMASKQSSFAAFHTPLNVANALAMALTSTVPWEDSLLEPAVGSGALAVAIWFEVARSLRAAVDAGTLTPQESVARAREWAARIIAVDIDPDAAWAARANLSVRTGVTVNVFVGNSLTYGAEPLPTATYPRPLRPAHAA